ncbi:MAG TPA: hypothetical protein VF144_07695 [Chitinophagaceae bacterium]
MDDRKFVPIAKWVRFSIINGFAAVISYLSAAFIPLPEMLVLLLAFLFGLFFMMSTLGMFFIIRSWRVSIQLYAGTVFNLVATAFVVLMLVVQQTGFAFHESFETQSKTGVTDEQLKWMFKEVNSVQLGIDITWDIFVSAGTFLLALSLYGHPVYKKIFTYTGVLFSLLLFTFNFYYFPEPPADAGSIDFGPFVSAWYLSLTIVTLIKRRKLVAIANAGTG